MGDRSASRAQSWTSCFITVTVTPSPLRWTAWSSFRTTALHREAGTDAPRARETGSERYTYVTGPDEPHPGTRAQKYIMKSGRQ